MDADLDLLLTAVFVTADDLLPERAKNARRSVTDAEVVTLSASRRRSWVSRLTDGSSRSLPSDCAICFPGCPGNQDISSADVAWLRHWSG
jgi:hypothetical protein